MSQYGQYYWCVETRDEEIHFHADQLSVSDSGALFCHYKRDGQLIPSLIFAPNEWIAVYPASCIDGRAVSIEHRVSK